MSSSITRYLPTDKFHILPISGITPDDLKQSAKACFRDKEKVSHTTLLNWLSKQMGFSGGFSGYREDFTESVLPFMKKHGLHKQADLLSPQKLPEVGMPSLKLSVEQVSDRLFKSGKALPDKIFTGYNFDYKSRFDDVLWDFNQWSYSSMRGRLNIGDKACTQFLKSVIEAPLEIKKGDHNRTHLELVLGGYLFDCIQPAFNLMGSLLLDPIDSEFMVSQRYWHGEYDLEEKLQSDQASKLVGHLFRHTIESSYGGWVDVIPYNENLVFLRGDNGQYDFIINNSRSSGFSHQIYKPFLSRADVPTQMNEEYHFQRWFYFEYEGWREQDEHRAEQSYYDEGGNVRSYPGTWSILRMYFIKEGVFKPWGAKPSRFKELPFQIYRTQLDSHSLYVSDLIPISELMRFSNKNPEYFKLREKLEAEENMDQLLPMNSDNPNLPAAVTWFDACAYLNYIEETYGLPVRLLKIQEYQAIRQQCGDRFTASSMMPNGTIDINDSEGINQAAAFPFLSDGLLEFCSDGMSFGSHPKYMADEKFQKLECIYVDTLKYSRHPSGLKFVDSDSFCEWLYENPYGRDAACVRSKSLSSIYGSDSLERELFPAWSTGKYKHVKVGFRLCYAISD